MMLQKVTITVPTELGMNFYNGKEIFYTEMHQRRVLGFVAESVTEFLQISLKHGKVQLF